MIIVTHIMRITKAKMVANSVPIGFDIYVLSSGFVHVFRLVYKFKKLIGRNVFLFSLENLLYGANVKGIT